LKGPDQDQDVAIYGYISIGELLKSQIASDTQRGR